MKNPFKRFRQSPTPVPEFIPDQPTGSVDLRVDAKSADESAPQEPKDTFTQWCRSQVHGGIERRERNDIFEAYSVYGVDSGGNLTCRLYHRYPEHERDFGLSYSRILTFDEFNRRLLAELDRGDVSLTDYHACMIQAADIIAADNETFSAIHDFSDSEAASLRAFCDGIDIVQDQSYLHSGGVFGCECISAVGEERLNIRFRRPIPFDALSADVPGVLKEPVGGYDIDNLWIMGVYNRLRDNCASCEVTRLTSEWSINREFLYLIAAADFAGIEGNLLVAVGDAESFRRFGFYSLDFSKK